MATIKVDDRRWFNAPCPENRCQCHWQCSLTSRTIINICATDNRDDVSKIGYMGYQEIYTRSRDSWSKKPDQDLNLDTLTEAMRVLQSRYAKRIRALNIKE